MSSALPVAGLAPWLRGGALVPGCTCAGGGALGDAAGGRACGCACAGLAAGTGSGFATCGVGGATGAACLGGADSGGGPRWGIGRVTGAATAGCEGTARGSAGRCGGGGVGPARRQAVRVVVPRRAELAGHAFPQLRRRSNGRDLRRRRRDLRRNRLSSWFSVARLRRPPARFHRRGSDGRDLRRHRRRHGATRRRLSWCLRRSHRRWRSARRRLRRRCAIGRRRHGCGLRLNNGRCGRGAWCGRCWWWRNGCRRLRRRSFRGPSFIPLAGCLVWLQPYAWPPEEALWAAAHRVGVTTLMAGAATGAGVLISLRAVSLSGLPGFAASCCCCAAKLVDDGGRRRTSDRGPLEHARRRLVTGGARTADAAFRRRNRGDRGDGRTGYHRRRYPHCSSLYGLRLHERRRGHGDDRARTCRLT